MGLHSHQDTFIGPKFRKQRGISTVAPLFLVLVLSSNHQNPQEIIKLSSKQNKILKTKKIVQAFSNIPLSKCHLQTFKMIFVIVAIHK